MNIYKNEAMDPNVPAYQRKHNTRGHEDGNWKAKTGDPDMPPTGSGNPADVDREKNKLNPRQQRDWNSGVQEGMSDVDQFIRDELADDTPDDIIVRGLMDEYGFDEHSARTLLSDFLNKPDQNITMENNELTDIKKLAGIKESILGDNVPANISITAGSGEELSSMLKDIMTLAGASPVTQDDMPIDNPETGPSKIISAPPMRSMIDVVDGDVEEPSDAQGDDGETADMVVDVVDDEETDESAGMYTNSPEEEYRKDPMRQYGDANSGSHNPYRQVGLPVGNPNTVTGEALYKDYQKFIAESNIDESDDTKSSWWEVHYTKERKNRSGDERDDRSSNEYTKVRASSKEEAIAKVKSSAERSKTGMCYGFSAKAISGSSSTDLDESKTTRTTKAGNTVTTTPTGLVHKMGHDTKWEPSSSDKIPKRTGRMTNAKKERDSGTAPVTGTITRTPGKTVHQAGDNYGKEYNTSHGSGITKLSPLRLPDGGKFGGSHDSRKFK